MFLENLQRGEESFIDILLQLLFAIHGLILVVGIPVTPVRFLKRPAISFGSSFVLKSSLY